MARKSKSLKNSKGVVKIGLLAVAFMLFGIVLGVAIKERLSPKEAESYAGQKGSPSKPPRGINNYVTGTVYSSTGGIVAHARVQASQKSVSRNVYSDENGKYTLTYPYCENCKSVIIYGANGYAEQWIDTYQVAGGTLVQDVVLQKL